MSVILWTERAAGLAAAVICPIGFVCDHVEVLSDLDTEAAQVCRDVRLPMARAATVNDDPLFLVTTLPEAPMLVQHEGESTARPQVRSRSKRSNWGQ